MSSVRIEHEMGSHTFDANVAIDDFTNAQAGGVTITYAPEDSIRCEKLTK